MEREKEAPIRAVEAAEKARKTAARRKREDEQSMATIDRTTKKCPGCSWAIEKNSGCSHMGCTNALCEAELCWECLADHKVIISKDDSAHKKTCKFYPANCAPRYMGGPIRDGNRYADDAFMDHCSYEPWHTRTRCRRDAFATVHGSICRIVRKCE
ncbi:hypothetical protein EV126DRAFT_39225 [Verticillium dahliae]|nr:hypothetical protein EV126DRAFT_39225 [Verticillium dahliae]